MIIPYDTSSISAKLKAAFNGGAKVVPTKEVNAELNRKNGAEVVKERAKRKALMDELANVKTSDARKQEIIDGLQAQLDTAQTALEETTAKVEELSPAAKAWKSFEHKERTKLIEGFPPEKRNAVKKIAESLSIDDFREYATSLIGAPATAAKTGGKDGIKDWNTIMSGTDTAAIDKAISDDPAGFNKFMDEKK